MKSHFAYIRLCICNLFSLFSLHQRNDLSLCVTSSLREVAFVKQPFFSPCAAEKELCALVLVTVCFRVQKTLAAEPQEKGGVQGQRNSLSSLLPLINTRVIPALLRCVYACWCGFTVDGKRCDIII